MLTSPIFIVGAPRSGTSLLQKVLRNHPHLWSLPSESEFIFDTYFHPELFNWEVEKSMNLILDKPQEQYIRNMYEKYLAPAIFWQRPGINNLIWADRFPEIWLKKIFNVTYFGFQPLLHKLMWQNSEKRFVDKSITHCLRLKALQSLFPNSKFIFITRNGLDTTLSLIKGWQHPTRFYSYNVPTTLNIKNYSHQRWNFLLPPNWQNLVDKTIEEVCATQWVVANEAILQARTELQLENRFFQLKLESLIQSPQEYLTQISDFIELPYDSYFSELARNLPVVNASNQSLLLNHVNTETINRIIAPTLRTLDY